MSATTQGREAYLSYARTGGPWTRVAKTAGRATSTVRVWAWDYAHAADLPWPPLSPKQLHRKAMGLAGEADAAEHGFGPPCPRAWAEAFALERHAAALSAGSQPAHAILCRSAAWLGIKAGEPAAGLAVALAGLSAEAVPARVGQELREAVTAATDALGEGGEE